jgi:hypothetical protein
MPPVNKRCLQGVCDGDWQTSNPNSLVENRLFLGIYGALFIRFFGILGAEVRHSGGTYSYMFLY